MCCSHWSFLEALQKRGDATDSRHRRDMELRRMSRRTVAKVFVKRLHSLWSAVLKRRGVVSRGVV